MNIHVHVHFAIVSCTAMFRTCTQCHIHLLVNAISVPGKQPQYPFFTFDLLEWWVWSSSDSIHSLVCKALSSSISTSSRPSDATEIDNHHTLYMNIVTMVHIMLVLPLRAVCLADTLHDNNNPSDLPTNHLSLGRVELVPS